MNCYSKLSKTIAKSIAMLNHLFNLFNSIIPLSDELKGNLISIIKTSAYKKNDHMLRRGQLNENVYFIEEGLVRSYHIKNDHEVGSWFMKEGDVLLSPKSFYNRQPSDENLQCLEDTMVDYISYSELQDLYNRFTEFNIVGRVLTEKYYVQSEERLNSIKGLSAKECYVYFINNYPDLSQRLNGKYIAAYLGITTETLSRIKLN